MSAGYRRVGQQWDRNGYGLEKLGMRFEGEAHLFGLHLVRHAITGDGWRTPPSR